jgi:hypothetical protein
MKEKGLWEPAVVHIFYQKERKTVLEHCNEEAPPVAGPRRSSRGSLQESSLFHRASRYLAEEAYARKMAKN